MNEIDKTRASLLIKVRSNEDDGAWGQFVEIYAPLVYAYGRRHRLQDADAADLAQDVMSKVSTAITSFEYDPDRGSFRGWLFAVTRNELYQQANQKKKHPQGSGETAVQELLAQQADDTDDAEMWNREHKLRLFHWAAQKVKGNFSQRSWDTFWQTFVENRPADQVAEGLGLTVGNVYVTKSRILARIRDKIDEVESGWGQHDSQTDAV